MRYEVRISGTGGQGVVLAGIILAEAVTLKPGWRVVQTVSYGPQVRGGMSSAEVVMSEEEIDYPRPMMLDVLVPMTQEACDEGVRMMKPKGVIVLDPALVDHAPEGWVATVPVTRLAKEATGRSQMANIVALGAISALSCPVEPHFLETAVKLRAPNGLEEAFVKALQAGREYAEKALGQIVYEEAPSPED
ncbi:MAG: 2-oxoacid:acceptor oxidoreductase family protein [Thermodesulfobacteriota bacterium]